ncbi:conjugal transfer protein TrbL family protein [Catellatospora sichuanensis]|uniref:conjugal transfer protein TrbL family protein n=1 Tax=Catellatospora sichuanensis TaxID=1969805 RepID=UPI0011837877
MFPPIPLPDVGDLIPGSPVQAMLNSLNTFLAQVLLDVLSSLLDLLGASVFTSPDVTVLPQVQQVTATSVGVVNTCFVVAVLAAGAMTMAGGVVQVRHSISELGSRLVVAFIGANFAAPLCSGLIELANAITGAMTAGSIWAPQSLTTLRDLITAAQADLSGTTAFLFTVVLVLIAVLAGLLMCQWIVRVGILIVLAAIAPVALACHGLPGTDGAARAWWRSLLAALGTQVLQAVSLHLCVQVLVGDGTKMLARGAAGRQLSVLHLFVVLVLLWGTARIPGLMRQFVTRGGGGPRLGSYLFKTVVLHRGMSLLRPGRTAGRAGGAAQVVNIRNISYNRLATPAVPPGRPGNRTPTGTGWPTSTRPSPRPPAGATPARPNPQQTRPRPRRRP